MKCFIFTEVVVPFVIKLKICSYIVCRLSSINFIENKQNWMLSRMWLFGYEVKIKKNQQRSQNRYFYNLTNAWHIPFLSQTTHQSCSPLHLDSLKRIITVHCSRGRSIFWTVSNPYQEMCLLGTWVLDCIMEVRQSLNLMENGVVGTFCSCRKKSFHNHVWKKIPLMVSFAIRIWWRPVGCTKDTYFSESLTSSIVKCWFSVPHMWRW